MIEVYRPGKLFIAGEYSVVETGRKAIVSAINRFIVVKIWKSREYKVTSFNGAWTHFELTPDGELIFTDDKEKWAYIKSSIKLSLKYLKTQNVDFEPFEIEVKSQMEDKNGKKYGIGSSASVTVAVIEAIFKHFGKFISKDQLFKLSCLSTLHISLDNSCADIAAVVYTGIVYYQKFDTFKLISEIRNMEIYDIVNSPWEGLSIENIEVNDSWDFLVAWTESPASSKNLVRKVKETAGQDSFYIDFQDKSDEIVEDIKDSYINKDFEKFKLSIERARENLLRLDCKYDVGIETRKLKELSELANLCGYASKLSGAGGGDCGIAFYPNKDERKLMIDKWKENNIIYLNFEIFSEDKNGKQKR